MTSEDLRILAKSYLDDIRPGKIDFESEDWRLYVCEKQAIDDIFDNLTKIGPARFIKHTKWVMDQLKSNHSSKLNEYVNAEHELVNEEEC